MVIIHAGYFQPVQQGTLLLFGRESMKEKTYGIFLFQSQPDIPDNLVQPGKGPQNPVVPGCGPVVQTPALQRTEESGDIFRSAEYTNGGIVALGCFSAEITLPEGVLQEFSAQFFIGMPAPGDILPQSQIELAHPGDGG